MVADLVQSLKDVDHHQKMVPRGQARTMLPSLMSASSLRFSVGRLKQLGPSHILSKLTF